jgi:hypothetical protein
MSGLIRREGYCIPHVNTRIKMFILYKVLNMVYISPKTYRIIICITNGVSTEAKQMIVKAETIGDKCGIQYPSLLIRPLITKMWLLWYHLLSLVSIFID